MIGVNICIIEDGKILLTKREDFEIWCLPGGHCDPGESLAQAAVREAKEEIGLDVQLLHLVGMYSRPAWRNGQYHLAVFAAAVIGGELKMQPTEVIDIARFSRDEIPAEIVLGHRQRCFDALDGLMGVVRTEGGAYPFGDDVDRQTLYQLCAESDLSPAEFYLSYFKENGHIEPDVSGVQINQI